MLLIAAGLILHSFVNLLRSDPGFRPQQVLTAGISLPDEHYKTAQQSPAVLLPADREPRKLSPACSPPA